MGRKRKKVGIPVTFYLRVDLYEKLKKRKNMSDVVEEALDFIFHGQEVVIKRREELEELKVHYSMILKEKERLEKENERLRKKLEKTEAELEALREKWKGQTKIDRYVRKSEEMKVLAERIQEHIAEGKTWEDVMQELGILERGDMVDIFKKLWLQRGEGYISTVVPGWKLKDHSGNRRGIFGYVFKRAENGHATPVRVAEVST